MFVIKTNKRKTDYLVFILSINLINKEFCDFKCMFFEEVQFFLGETRSCDRKSFEIG